MKRKRCQKCGETRTDSVRCYCGHLHERLALPAIWVLSCAKCGGLLDSSTSIDRREALDCRRGIDVCYVCDADMTDADMEMRPRAFRTVRYVPVGKVQYLRRGHAKPS